MLQLHELPQEALALIFVRAKAGPHKFECYHPLNPAVASFVDLAIPPAPRISITSYGPTRDPAGKGITAEWTKSLRLSI